MNLNSTFVWILSFVALGYMMALVFFFAVLLHRIDDGKPITTRNGKSTIRIAKGVNLIGMLIAAGWLLPLVTRVFKYVNNESIGLPSLAFIVTVAGVIVFLWREFEVTSWRKI